MQLLCLLCKVEVVLMGFLCQVDVAVGLLMEVEVVVLLVEVKAVVLLVMEVVVLLVEHKCKHNKELILTMPSMLRMMRVTLMEMGLLRRGRKSVLLMYGNTSPRRLW